MKIKKEMILAVTLLLIVVNLINFISILTITGKATAVATGTSSLCINQPPTVVAIIDQNATTGTLFSLQINASDPDGNALEYFDNTTIFNISSSGLISFTPSDSDVGNHSILITIGDNVGCQLNVSKSFLLNINLSGVVPTPPATPSASGGGGGGARATRIKEIIDEKLISFSISEEVIKVALTTSQLLEKTITINNDGAEDINIELAYIQENIVDISPRTFNLAKGETKEIMFIFNPNKNLKPGIYPGLINVKGISETKEIIKNIEILLEVESVGVLFDASINMPKKTFLPNEDLKAIITLFNLQRIYPAKVKLSHQIMDFNGNVVYKSDELITLEESVSFSKTISLEGINTGDYIYSISILYKDSFATATEIFVIQEPLQPALVGLAGLGVGRVSRVALQSMAILIFGILVFIYFIRKRVNHAHDKADQNTRNHEIVNRKLKNFRIKKKTKRAIPKKAKTSKNTKKKERVIGSDLRKLFR
jgi:hypothetical protein